MSPRVSLVSRPCSICNNLTDEFNYGVISCNPCKMVFRRVMKFETKFDHCLCGNKKSTSCRCCRFSACIAGGMKISCIQKYKHATLIQNLIKMDHKRNNTFFNYQMCEDLSLDQLMISGVPKIKDQGVRFTSHDWVSMEIYSTIEFMKNLDLVHILTSNDLMIFVKNAHFKCAIFFIAVRSYMAKMEFMTFPDNVDVFPEEISNVPDYSPKLLNRIRTLLISKFREFDVSIEELLLVVTIIICDPSVAGLSEFSMNVISQYQRIYSSALQAICQNKCKASWPTRFTNLLFLSNILTKTIKDLDDVVVLFKYHQPALPLRKLVKDSF
ncbi:Protein CBG16589 [Caenorhabditis briggsae]|uniref:Protein CBG16589 n=2 Tax=Caenorhabditis briggsae TaxID=6238 RepID=A8XPJ1_CAEBR|nr:Protein CBG16589 [Caenorhabditis briggsae]ULU01155.1 hypothetical protein L3Y34_001491 [Caenorhabditis briggsae]CAP34512.1 Protein CBG16589 [Caenorhabditis briggsae]